MVVFRSAWFWGLIGFGLVMVLYVILAALGWPGTPDSCTLPGGNCYCEAYPLPPATALVKQPANTWSGLFAVIAGIIVLAMSDRDRAAGSTANPIRSGGFYAIAYGALLVFLGPGAMFFHGGLTHFGGWMDNFSMILYVSFILLYDTSRVWNWSDRVGLFVGIFIAINVAFGLLTWFVAGSGTFVFAGLAVIAVVAQIVILWKHPGGINRRFLPWLLAGFISFGIAVVIWALSFTGAPLCNPNSLLQGHAVWHLLAMALTPFFIYLYLREETKS
jgi:Ceramidase